MLRKTISKILSIRKKTSRTTFDTADIMHEYADDANPDETETSRVFRHAFIDKFTLFKLEADILAEGNANFNDTWKDTIGKEGLGVSIVVIAGVLGLLGGLTILSAAASAGASIAVAVVGVIIGVAIYKYRDFIKQQRYEAASAFLDQDDLRESILEIASVLADMYQVQLAGCTIKDAHKLAESCVRAISNDMLKNEHFHFDELMDPATLQAVLMRALSAMPKERLDMNLVTNKKYYTRGMVSHSAYYIRETNEFYKASTSKSMKYGVLLFDRKIDLDDYESILAETMKDSKKWKFTKMRQHEVDALLESSLFKAYRNDKLFTEKHESGIEKKNERLRIV